MQIKTDATKPQGRKNIQFLLWLFNINLLRENQILTKKLLLQSSFHGSDYNSLIPSAPNIPESKTSGSRLES